MGTVRRPRTICARVAIFWTIFMYSPLLKNWKLWNMAQSVGQKSKVNYQGTWLTFRAVLVPFLSCLVCLVTSTKRTKQDQNEIKTAPNLNHVARFSHERFHSTFCFCCCDAQRIYEGRGTNFNEQVLSEAACTKPRYYHLKHFKNYYALP